MRLGKYTLIFIKFKQNIFYNISVYNNYNLLYNMHYIFKILRYLEYIKYP